MQCNFKPAKIELKVEDEKENLDKLQKMVNEAESKLVNLKEEKFRIECEVYFSKKNLFILMK